MYEPMTQPDDAAPRVARDIDMKLEDIDGKDLLRGALYSAVRLAITRHNIELEEDTATEEEVAEDAAGACFGEECCDDMPIPEVTELLRRLAIGTLLTERERELKEALRVAQALIEPLIETDSAMRPEWDDEAERCLKSIQGLLGD